MASPLEIAGLVPVLQIADFAIRGNYSYLRQPVKIGCPRASATAELAYGAPLGAVAASIYGSPLVHPVALSGTQFADCPAYAARRFAVHDDYLPSRWTINIATSAGVMPVMRLA